MPWHHPGITAAELDFLLTRFDRYGPGLLDVRLRGYVVGDYPTIAYLTFQRRPEVRPAMHHAMDYIIILTNRALLFISQGWYYFIHRRYRSWPMGRTGIWVQFTTWHELAYFGR